MRRNKTETENKIYIYCSGNGVYTIRRGIPTRIISLCRNILRRLVGTCSISFNSMFISEDEKVHWVFMNSMPHSRIGIHRKNNARVKKTTPSYVSRFSSALFTRSITSLPLVFLKVLLATLLISPTPSDVSITTP